MADQKKFDPRRTSAQTPDAKAGMPTERPKPVESDQAEEKPAEQDEPDAGEKPEKKNEKGGRT